MFPFRAFTQQTASERNAARDEEILRATRNALGAARRIVADLERLTEEMSSEIWRQRDAHGAHYHRAEYVGRQFDDIGHPLTTLHEQGILACAYAGGYEPEVSA